MEGRSGRIVSLQVLRFIAALAVVMHHAAGAVSTDAEGVVHRSALAKTGAAGVDIFFVISGFIIARIAFAAERRPTAAGFFWRRWRRIAPVYYLLSVPQIVWAIVGGTFTAAAATATFLFWPVHGGRIAMPFNGLGWTLCLEFAFYVAVSLLLVGGRIRRNAVIAATLVGGLLAARIATDSTTVRVLTNSLFLEFGAGALLVAASPRLRRLSMWIGAALLLAGFAAYPIEAASGFYLDYTGETSVGGLDWGRPVEWGLPATAIVAGALVCERHLRGRAVEFMASLGDASYSIYLTQTLVMRSFVLGAIWMFGLGSIAPIWTSAVVGSVAAGVVVYRLIEMPILRDLKRLKPPRLGWLRPAAVSEPGADQA